MTIIENLQSLFQSGKTFTAKELLAALALSEQDTKPLHKALEQLSRDNLIYASPRGKYGLPEAFSLSVGTLQGSRGEYCFFIPQDKSGDLYIAAPGSAYRLARRYRLGSRTARKRRAQGAGRSSARDRSRQRNRGGNLGFLR